jgi:spore coat polysaccharide biosynthesis protein SpsF
MKIIASIQARMGATRLPNKVLREIAGKPMLLWQVERIRRSRLVDQVVVATTVNPKDDAIVRMCDANGIAWYRGPENDVLGRIAGLLRQYNAEVHVECFGDSPLIDPHLIDEFCGYLLKHFNETDIVLNSLRTTYPPGQEVIVYKAEALLNAHARVAPDDPLREHVSIHLYKHPELYRIKNLEAPEHYHEPDLYLEVDTAQDLLVMSQIIEHFKERGDEHFSLAQILDFMRKNEDIGMINQGVERRWKQYRDDD